MKLPYSWLKEISGVSWSADEAADRLTLSGTAGLAESHNREHFKNVVVGQISSLEKHPNADKLQVANVTTGSDEWQIICGAPNCEAGQKVIVALPGACLKGEFDIKEIKMRGVKSAGMICAEDELGLSDDHGGIIVLDESAPLGVDAYEYLNLDEAVIGFEITPNRPDCLSANGVARELAVLDGRRLELSAPAVSESSEKASDQIKVIIEDSHGCPRYTARIIKNVKVGPSPDWMQKRLLDCGVRSINNIVDISNYVMLETNQPLHAFDYDRFGSREVIIRQANDGELFTTLDGQEHKLDSSVLMITNGKIGVAAAGVMGGLNSEVEEGTTTILLESAYFDPSVIRKSRNRLGLSSESSYRFERGIDPNGVVSASDRAAQLMAELAGGEVLAGVVDNIARPIEPITVNLRRSQVSRLLGVDLPGNFISETLNNLGFDLSENKAELITAVIPTFRPDVSREVDLIEEVARIFGMGNIPNSTHNSGPLYSPTHRRDTIKEQLRQIMTGFGYDEMLGTGFANPDLMQKIEPAVKPIRLTNPISDDFGYMRTRMLYSMLVAAGHNIRHRNIDFKLFEIGRVYIPQDKMPDQPYSFGLIATGQSLAPYWKNGSEALDLFEIKGLLTSLSDSLSVWPFVIEPEVVAGYDKGLSFVIKCGTVRVGSIGMVDQKTARLFDIKQKAFAAELNLEIISSMEKRISPYQPLPKYPGSSRDVAIVVDNHLQAEEMRQSIISSGGELVRAVTVFDLFTGGQVPEGKKSVAFSIDFRSSDRTLQDEEVDRVFKKIVNTLVDKFKAGLRE